MAYITAQQFVTPTSFSIPEDGKIYAETCMSNELLYCGVYCMRISFDICLTVHH